MANKSQIIVSMKVQIILFAIIFLFIIAIIGWQILSTIQTYSKLAELNSQVKDVALYAKEVDNRLIDLDARVNRERLSAAMYSASAADIKSINSQMQELTTTINTLKTRLDRVSNQASAACGYVSAAFGVNCH